MDGETQNGGLRRARWDAAAKVKLWAAPETPLPDDGKRMNNAASRTDPRFGTVLIIEADRIVLEQRAKEMAEHGYRVQATSNLAEATLVIQVEKPRFAVVNYRLHDEVGFSLIAPLMAFAPAARVVVVSQYASLRGAVSAIRMRAAEFLAGPTTSGEIDAVLRGFSAACRLSHVISSTLKDIDRRHAETTLCAMGRNVPATARILGIETRTLRRLLAR